MKARSITLVALLAWTPTALGAPGDPGEPELPPIEFGTATEPVDDAPAPEATAVAFAGSYRWMAVGPATLSDVADVALHPDDSTLIAFVTDGGSAWLSEDGGLRWREVLVSIDELGGLSTDEDLIRDVEAFIEDVATDVAADDPTDYEDFGDAEDEAAAIADALAEAADQARSAADTVRGDVDTGAALVDVDRADGAPPRVWWGPNGELLVSRHDGLHLSFDNGARFQVVLDVQVHALAYLPSRGLWVAGTEDGVRWALDPRGWIDSEDATTGVAVRDLSVGPEGMYAATDHGVFFAADAQYWERLGEPADYFAVEADPAWAGGFWVADAARVYRSDNQGQSLRASLGAPLRQVSDIHRVANGQLLVATGSDGPWESMDGGTRFTPMPDGLSNPDTRRLTVRGRAVYLAAEEGLFRLQPQRAPAEDEEPESPYVPLGALLSAATERPGLAPRLPRSQVFLRSVLPAVQIEGYRHDGADLFWNGGTTRGVDSEWRISTRLVFSPRPGRRVGGDVDDGATSVLVMPDGVELVSDLEGVTGSMDRRSRRGALTYRSTLIERISSLYGARIELAGRPRTDLTLAEAVELELRIRELDAELDLLTEGAVSQWTLDSREEG